MTRNDTQPHISAFTADQLPGVERLSQQAGWPHRYDDLALIVNNCKGVAVVDKNQVMGTAFAANFGPSVTMINLIMVDESLRGRGIGRALMTQIMTIAGAREQRLIATQAGIVLYEKLGFMSTGVVFQHQGSLERVADPGGISWCRPDDRDAIIKLDTQATGMQRGSLIDALLDSGRIAVTREGHSITGFVVLREFGRGEVAGPVVARNNDEARALLSFVFSTRPGVFMRVDTDAQSDLSPWLEQRGLICVAQGQRMVLNAISTEKDNAATTYALASQALG